MHAPGRLHQNQYGDPSSTIWFPTWILDDASAEKSSQSHQKRGCANRLALFFWTWKRLTTQSGRSVYYINCTYKNIQSTWYVCWEGFSQAGALQFKWKRPHQAGDICMQVWRKAHRFRRSYIRFEIAARSTHGFHLFIHWNEYVNFDIWIWEYTNSQIQILNFTYSFQCIHTWNLFELRTFPAIICRYFDAHVRHWYDYSEQIPRLYARQRRRNDTK